MPKKSTSKWDRVSVSRLVVIGVACLAILGVAGVPLLRNYRIERYLARSDVMLSRAAKVIGRMEDSGVAEGASDEEVAAEAKKALEQLRLTSRTLSEASRELRDMRVPARARNYHNRLVDLCTSGSSLCTDLVDTVETVDERAAWLQGVDLAVKAFDSRLKGARADNEVVDAAGVLETQLSECAEQLAAMDKPDSWVYSDDVLSRYLDRLSIGSRYLAEGVKRNDRATVEQSVAVFRDVLSQDWGSALLAQDADALRAYRERVGRLYELEQRVQSEREVLGSAP